MMLRGPNIESARAESSIVVTLADLIVYKSVKHARKDYEFTRHSSERDKLSYLFGNESSERNVVKGAC